MSAGAVLGMRESMTDDSIRIAPGGHVTIPEAAFRAAALRDGAEVRVRAQGQGRIVIESADHWDDATDMAWGGAYGANGLDTMR